MGRVDRRRTTLGLAGRVERPTPGLCTHPIRSSWELRRVNCVKECVKIASKGGDIARCPARTYPARNNRSRGCCERYAGETEIPRICRDDGRRRVRAARLALQGGCRMKRFKHPRWPLPVAI
jgi:hypothetical protein